MPLMPTQKKCLFAINHDKIDASCNAHFQLLVADYKFSIKFEEHAEYFSDKSIKPGINEWTHVCLLRRQNEMLPGHYLYFLYVNATKVGGLTSKIHRHSGEPENYVLNIGGEADVKDHKCIIRNKKKLFVGEISKVYMFNNTLSSSEIEELFYHDKTQANTIVTWNDFRGKADGKFNYQQECGFNPQL